MNEALKRIQEYALEDIMGLRFGAYAKEIIQDRAIPDARDGLKPVQRRILFDMYKNNNTCEKPYVKCAFTVGSVLGKWHPHGDSSVYEAMVRMSQWWKQNHILVDMHGNNGSMDGDGPAAYRYTEARLSKISNELLEALDKNTVSWAPNFDDRFLEPTVLPVKFPNLLVNGTNGISAGYATNIPPHNLGEIIDATIKRIDSPNCRLDSILEIVKGPDFPTGGIVMGTSGIIDAFKTGRGRVIVRSKYEYVKNKGKEQIVITEVPFEVNKALMVQKIDSIRIDKKIDGILEVRDETDRDGIRIVIDLKQGASKELITNYLLKNTDMQVSYNYNMVSIVNRRPATLGILPLLDAFIAHRREVVIKRTEFDLAVDEKRCHILEGFIRALSILDDVIRVIRASKNKADAIENLVKEFDFTHEQADAIVMMQLYKLTNTDVVELNEEHDRLLEEIKYFKEILSDENALIRLIKEELKAVKKEYALPRKTVITDETGEVKIDELDMVSKEDFVVCISAAGYVKKHSMKVFTSNEKEYPTVKEGDYIEGLYKVNNLDTILLFTNQGNYLYLPVREITECKFKDLGTHISNIIKISDGENIIKSIAINKFDNSYITAFTKNGMAKRVELKEFEVSRYTKPILMFKLKDKDELVSVSRCNGEYSAIFTENGYSLKFKTEELPVVGLRASGVKAIKLSPGDNVVNAFVISPLKEYISIFTNRNTAKRLKVEDINLLTRAKKGSIVIKSPKSKTYNLFRVFNTSSKSIFGIITDEIGYVKSSDINIMDNQSTGSAFTKKSVNDIFVVTKYTDITKNDKGDSDIDETIDNNEQTDETKQVEIISEPIEEVKEEPVKKEKPVKEEKPKEEKKEEVTEQLTMSDFFEEFKI